MGVDSWPEPQSKRLPTQPYEKPTREPTCEPNAAAAIVKSVMHQGCAGVISHERRTPNSRIAPANAVYHKASHPGPSPVAQLPSLLGVVSAAAIYSYVMAHVLRPEAAAYINLGVVLRQSGRIAAARSAFNQAVAHTPGVSAAFTNLATLPGTAPEEAAALLLRAVSLAPSDGISYAALAGVLKRRGDHGGAQAAHALSLRLSPASGTLHFGDWRAWWLAFYERRQQQQRSTDGIQYQVS